VSLTYLLNISSHVSAVANKQFPIFVCGECARLPQGPQVRLIKRKGYKSRKIYIGGPPSMFPYRSHPPVTWWVCVCVHKCTLRTMQCVLVCMPPNMQWPSMRQSVCVSYVMSCMHVCMSHTHTHRRVARVEACPSNIFAPKDQAPYPKGVALGGKPFGILTKTTTFNFRQRLVGPCLGIGANTHHCPQCDSLIDLLHRDNEQRYGNDCYHFFRPTFSDCAVRKNGVLVKGRLTTL
jgi:hypothetical protein